LSTRELPNLAGNQRGGHIHAVQYVAHVVQDTGSDLGHARFAREFDELPLCGGQFLITANARAALRQHGSDLASQDADLAGAVRLRLSPPENDHHALRAALHGYRQRQVRGAQER
jgi:hypothetical protein